MEFMDKMNNGSSVQSVQKQKKIKKNPKISVKQKKIVEPDEFSLPDIHENFVIYSFQ